MAEPASKRHKTSSSALASAAIHEVEVLACPKLPGYPGANVPNTNGWAGEDSSLPKTGYNQMIGDDQVIVTDVVRSAKTPNTSKAFMRGGPRESLYFEASKVTAAIVTCGGLCPGLNDVVRALTVTLRKLYRVNTVLGVRNGYLGFHPGAEPPMELTPAVVSDIHHHGGTVLGAARGGFDADIIRSSLKEWGVSMLFIIGGDGTHRGAHKLQLALDAAGDTLSIIGVPKTIDNDIGLIDRSFGFNTAVEEACKAIRSAKIEASCTPNGVGIVKLMGRSAGFIAAHAALSSGDADLCLIPEVDIEVEGHGSFLAHVERTIKAQGHAVVVVSEGAGEELLGQAAAVDQASQAAGAHAKLPPIGQYIKERVQTHLKTQGISTSIKYIDPSYMIRSVPANPADSLFCMLLGQNAVHAAMAGYTGSSVGLVNNHIALIPMQSLGEKSPRNLNPFGRTWERVMAITGQPRNTVQGSVEEWQRKATGVTVF